MAELHTNLYIKHADSSLHDKLGRLFKTINDKPETDYAKLEENLFLEALSINPEHGEQCVSQLLKCIKNEWSSLSEELVAESRYECHGFHCIHFVHSSSGTETLQAIVQFIGDLASGVDVRACLVGDDDPWEVFYRYENGEMVYHYYEPDWDETELPEIYQWWHQGLPASITDGFINRWLEDKHDEE